MRIAVVRFPGSNCDEDALNALSESLGFDAEFVLHGDSSLSGFDAALLPGGFAYGDYLRAGAIAARAPIMAEVARMAEAGRPVLGICNGFQILCEAGLLPGALVRNREERFVCRTVTLRPEGRSRTWTARIDHLLRIPVAHGEGRYVLDETGLDRLEKEERVVLRYVNERGEATSDANPNGSARNVAGVVNERGNVLGMMPHPERATRESLGSTDGVAILRAFFGDVA